MGVESHPAYREESLRLRAALGEIKGQLETLRSVPPLDITELFDDADDPMKATLVAEIALERMRLRNIRLLEVAEREPYFGRLDFQEQGEAEPEQFYIGKAGVERDDGQLCVVDWRTPVASLFYSTAAGAADEVAYDAPDGSIRGVLWLKRNLGVKQGLLQRIVDSKVKGAPTDEQPILDEFLSYRLQESRDTRLRDIVSTIQSEQNTVIRAPLNEPLIVQGVAGSGKTTVALHRLAYLLYTYRDSVAAGRIVIFAPNRMFLDYISDVLPELGVDGVLQTTFSDWALAELDEEIKIADIGERLAHLFAPGTDPSVAADAPGRFKGSLFFQEVLDLGLARYEEDFVPEADLELWPGAVLRAREVAAWYHQQYRMAPLMARKERCLARVKKWADDQLLRFQGGMREREHRKAMRAAVQRYVRLWPAHTALELYREILGGRPSPGRLPAPVGGPDIPRRVRLESLEALAEGEVHLEDLAPLVYLKGKLRGYKDDRQLDHVVIDEAQDFSPFQLDLLRRLTRDNSFTILGDLSQGIHAYQGIQDWTEFMAVFAPEPCSYVTLELSYRSTYEIMTFANAVISRVGAPAALARPVFRAGARVRVGYRTPEALPAAIGDEVQALRSRNHASIAVVGRTEEECRNLHAALANLGLDPELITPRQTNYRGGLSVMPVYLTKGLEFDAVIVADASSTAYQASPRDARLLYVACTRALHELTLFVTGQPSPLLEMDPATYEPYPAA